MKNQQKRSGKVMNRAQSAQKWSGREKNPSLAPSATSRITGFGLMVIAIYTYCNIRVRGDGLSKKRTSSRL